MLENKEKINENLIKKFAFLIHFRHDIRDDLKFYFDPLKKVPSFPEILATAPSGARLP